MMASVKKACIAGLAGTAVMTVFSFISHYLSLPKADFHGMIADHLHMGDAVAWIVYFGMGVGLAYGYGQFKDKLPAHSFGGGMMYALILWGAMEVILMPIFGMGFFSGSMMAAVSAFFGMMFYGATVGYLYEH